MLDSLRISLRFSLRGSFKGDFEAASPWSFMGVQGLSIFAGFQEGLVELSRALQRVYGLCFGDFAGG